LIKLIKKIVLKILTIVNLHASRLTDKNEVQSLLNKLKPIYYGKELIRIGAKNDGGYLVPDDLAGITACFSPGVADISEFEKYCADMGMNVFMADKSIEKPFQSHELFQFTNKHIGVITNEDFITIDDWVSSSVTRFQDDLLLQIDIEGSEYEVFLSASNKLMKRFRIIVVEFHNLNQLWNKPYFTFASRVFDKILQTHSCVHNHPNNFCDSVKKGNIEIPIVSELTFVRKDRIKSSSFVSTFPHRLDSDNNTSVPSLHLAKCWYN